MTDPGWDDDRLAAAFAARAGLARSTPPDLAVSVLATVALRPRTGPKVAFRRMAPGLGLAAAIAVAIAIGSAQLVQTPPAASASPGASDVAASVSAASPEPAASPAVTMSVVDELLANPITVSEAIARRDTNLDDTEIAVEGFAWYPPSGVIDCFDVIGHPAPFAGCERRATWLAESDQATPNILLLPKGPAFNLFIQPETVGADVRPPKPTRVIAMGHFNDHRAALCPPAQVDACRKHFVVDAMVSPDDRRIGGLVKVDENAAILTSVDDAIRFAGLEGNDRAIVAAFAIRTKALANIEPGVAGAAELIDVNTVWIVRWIDDGGPAGPVLRTRMVLEDGPDRLGVGSYEVTATGLDAVAPLSSTDPAFDAAPAQILGLHVMDVRTAIERQTLLARSEVAIRGWYVPPDPRATCAGQDPVIHPASSTCNEGRHWLLEQPEPWPASGTDPRPTGLFLNPAVPSDVPMPVPDTWADGTPEPWPVVIVGHFNDYRVGSSRFIVDALVWQRDGAVTDGSSVTRLTPDATESPEAVIARVETDLSPYEASNRELGPPLLTWTSVVTGAQFGVVEPDISEAAPEFLEARAVWIVRRLVSDRWDGQDRLIVDTAYTADGANRVWLHRADFGDADLETTLDLHDIDPRTALVRVFDYDQQIVSVRDVTPRDQLDWRYTIHKHMALLEIARGGSDREVAIRWTSGACDPEWRVLVNARSDAPGVFIQAQTFGPEYCPNDLAPRSIMLTFDHPVDLDAIRTTDEVLSGGG